jgi:hypothetical protein
VAHERLRETRRVVAKFVPFVRRSAVILAAGYAGILPARVGNSRDRPAESRRFTVANGASKSN